MPYEFVDDVSMADTAYEASGKTMEEMFVSAALALTTTQVRNIKAVERKEERSLRLKAKNLEKLLHDFLQEIIFYKDADYLLLSKFEIKIRKEPDGYSLDGKAFGEEIDMKKHELIVDVKAVSWHMYKVGYNEKAGQWECFVILDI